MLNIDKLRYNWEKPFLDLMEGMKQSENGYFTKYSKVYFQYDIESGYLWCHYKRVWSIFKSNYSTDYLEIQEIIKYVMEKYYKLNNCMPESICRIN